MQSIAKGAVLALPLEERTKLESDAGCRRLALDPHEQLDGRQRRLAEDRVEGFGGRELAKGAVDRVTDRHVLAVQRCADRGGDGNVRGDYEDARHERYSVSDASASLSTTSRSSSGEQGLGTS